MANCRLTPELQERLLQAIQLGIPYKHAAETVGISYDTLYHWMTKGRKANSGKFKELYDAIRKAESAAMMRKLAQIEREAQNGTWQAAAWFLERRFPQEWGRKDRIEHSGDEEKPVTVAIIKGVNLDEL